MKIGFGYDSHRLVAGRKLILGGIEIPHDKGPLGHSDGDVLIHALCDALLGALGAGDIGQHFPDHDHRYKDISSLKLLAAVKMMAEDRGACLFNVDATILLEAPKLLDYKAKMAASLAGILGLAPEMINIKAKTNEGMGLIGQGQGVAAFAVVTVKDKDLG